MNDILKKLLSGRLLLTIVCGIAFLYCVITKTLTSEAITGILMMVFTAYFNRNDRSNNEHIQKDS